MESKPTYDPSSWPFIRECQECGHRAIYKDPALYKNDKWLDIKCKRCSSQALDYGSKRPFTEQQVAEYRAWEKWENEHEEDE